MPWNQKQSNVASESLHLSLAFTAMAITLLTAGCSQQFWRKQADKDTYQILHEKESDPRWDNPRQGITPDPRSRFFDPYPPDAEAMSPDDPAAATEMESPNGIPGYKGWHQYGRAISIENPQWLSQFEFTPEMMDEETGEYVEPLPKIENLSILDAVELTYLHSRDYQFQLEEVYLTALALTLERFRFQVRYLGIGGGEPGGNLEYENVPGREDSLSMNSSFGVSQLLPTGGQWAMELANNTLWLFSGPNAGTTSASILSYRLVQPLLLTAGRKIALEDLTQTERDVLYSVRDLARFRKELFVDTVGGGYLGLLTQIQGIRNQEYNIDQLERQVTELRATASSPPGNTGSSLAAMPEGLVIPEELAEELRYDEIQEELVWSGAMSAEQAQELLALSDDPAFQSAAQELVQLLRSDVTPFDVIQIESELASARIRLLNSRRNFQDNLDRYKIQLGLPPDVQMSIDDSSLQQFELIDPILSELTNDFETSIEYVGLLDSLEPNRQEARSALDRLNDLYSRFLDEGIPLVETDAEKVMANRPERLANASSAQERERIIETIERDQEQFRNLRQQILAVKQDFEQVRQLLEQGETDQESLSTAIVRVKSMREDLIAKSQSLQVIQVGFRSELIDINRYEFSLEDSVGLALENRLDLMNQRAIVTDARRNVDVVANRLKSVMDVVVEGDVRARPGTANPFDFDGQSSSHRVGVQFSAPLDQVAERNQYRAAQIEYQRARRDYMAFEDSVKLDIRTAWRNLQALEENLETARQSLRIAVLQYDQAVEETNDPASTTNAGVRGRNLIDGLQRILDSQNNLIGIWADYERTRLEIYRDMGIMEIDENGLWVDPFYQEMYNDMNGSPTESDSPPSTEPQGRYDLTLLPPGPDNYGDLNPGKDNDRFPVESPQFPSQQATRANEDEAQPFVADPLDWQPGRGRGNPLLQRDVPAGGSKTVGTGSKDGTDGGEFDEREKGKDIPLVPAVDESDGRMVPEPQ